MTSWVLVGCQPTPPAVAPAAATTNAAAPSAAPQPAKEAPPQVAPISQEEGMRAAQEVRDWYADACATEPTRTKGFTSSAPHMDQDLLNYVDVRRAIQGIPDGNSAFEGLFDRSFAVWDKPNIAITQCERRQPDWPCLRPATAQVRQSRQEFLSRDELARFPAPPPKRAYALEQRLSEVRWLNHTLGCTNGLKYDLGATRDAAGEAKIVLLEARPERD